MRACPSHKELLVDEFLTVIGFVVAFDALADIPSMAISALGRAGKWKEAVQVLDGMGKGGDGGDRPDNFAYAAAINACGKAGRPVEVSKPLFGLESGKTG